MLRRTGESPHAVTRGLVIDKPWVDFIADGKKTWEMRTSPTKVRGWIGLNAKGTGTVIGLAYLEGSPPALERSAYYFHLKKHRTPPEPGHVRYSGRYVFPWVLAKAFRLPRPVPYRHPSGAVIWVKFADGVSQSLTRGLRARHYEERG